MKAGAKARRRPRPPEGLGLASNDDGTYPPRFAPADDVLAWVQREVLEDGGALFNPDHMHLRGVGLRFVWAGLRNIKQGRRIAGTAQKWQGSGDAWSVARSEDWFYGWWGDLLEFLITLDAEFCRTCSDAEFCALVEHELYHLAHERDDQGGRLYTSAGKPRVAVRSHDVEEFVGVVRRYGVPEGSNLAEMLRVARLKPEIAPLKLNAACGICALKSA